MPGMSDSASGYTAAEAFRTLYARSISVTDDLSRLELSTSLPIVTDSIVRSLTTVAEVRLFRAGRMREQKAIAIFDIDQIIRVVWGWPKSGWWLNGRLDTSFNMAVGMRVAAIITVLSRMYDYIIIFAYTSLPLFEAIDRSGGVNFSFVDIGLEEHMRHLRARDIARVGKNPKPGVADIDFIRRNSVSFAKGVDSVYPDLDTAFSAAIDRMIDSNEIATIIFAHSGTGKTTFVEGLIHKPLEQMPKIKEAVQRSYRSEMHVASRSMKMDMSALMVIEAAARESKESKLSTHIVYNRSVEETNHIMKP